MTRTIFCGDVHGCLDELDELVKTLEVRQSDRIVMLGDLIDRGPDPVGVVRRVRERGWQSILGNHEERAIRWLKNESFRKASGRQNPMVPPYAQRRKEWESLSADDVGWLWRLPLTVSVGDWRAVHAGLGPRPFLDQDVDDLLHIRYVDPFGRTVPVDPATMEQPPNTVFWTESWPGPESVLYGHSVFDEVRIDRRPSGATCLGLDTGCVYGGSLSSAVLHDGQMEIVSVRASREHFSYDDRLGPPPS